MTQLHTWLWKLCSCSKYWKHSGIFSPSSFHKTWPSILTFEWAKWLPSRCWSVCISFLCFVNLKLSSSSWATFTSRNLWGFIIFHFNSELYSQILVIYVQQKLFQVFCSKVTKGLVFACSPQIGRSYSLHNYVNFTIYSIFRHLCWHEVFFFQLWFLQIAECRCTQVGRWWDR